MNLCNSFVYRPTSYARTRIYSRYKIVTLFILMFNFLRDFLVKVVSRYINVHRMRIFLRFIRRYISLLLLAVSIITSSNHMQWRPLSDHIHVE